MHTAHTHVRTHTHAHTHTHMHTRMHTHKHTHTRTHRRMHAHACTHTHTHLTYAHTQGCFEILTLFNGMNIEAVFNSKNCTYSNLISQRIYISKVASNFIHQI